MTYQLARLSGDSLAVPQLVLNQLQRGDENLIRTALYILSTRSTDPADIAHALRLKSTAAAQRALDFWYGAGLLERAPEAAEPVEVRPWTQLDHVRAYYELFQAHGKEFEAQS